MLKTLTTDLAPIMEHMTLPVFLKDTENLILWANSPAAASMGTTPEELNNTHSKRWCSSRAGAHYAHDLDVIRSSKPKRGIEEWWQGGDGLGSKKIIDKYPLFSNSRTVAGILVVVRQQFSKQDEAADGSLVHDLSNWLLVASGNLDLLSRSSAAKDERLLAATAAVERAVGRLRGLQGSANEASAGRSADLVELNASMLELCAILKDSLFIGIDVRLDLHPSPLEVAGQLDLLEDAFFNLILNSCEAVGPGGIIRIRTYLDDASKKAVLSISDTGGGIRSDIQRLVFSQGFSTKGGSRGHGLASAKRTIEDHGGDLEFDSSSSGTEFRASLPLIQPSH